MAKTRGISSGDAEMVGNLENFAKAQSQGKQLGGLSGVVASMFAVGKDLAVDILKTEYARVKKKVNDEEQERIRKLTADLLKQRIQKKLDTKAQAELKAIRDKQKKEEQEHKQNMQRLKEQQSLLQSEKKLLQTQLQNTKDEGKRLSLQRKIGAIDDSLKANRKESTKAESRYESLSAQRNLQAGNLQNQLVQEAQGMLDKTNASLGLEGDNQIKLGDVSDLEQQSLNSLITQSQIAKNNYQATLAGGDDDDLMLGSLKRSGDRPTGSSFGGGGLSKDALQALTTAITSALRSAPAQSSPQAKAEANQAENLRADELAHRTEREELTDAYRLQVNKHFEELVYQAETIVGNQKHLYELISEGGLQTTGGGGLMDSVLELFSGGGKKGGGLVSKGLGLAKGALTKVAIPLALASGAYSGIKGGFDTEAIMKQKGIDDPSQVGISDRLHYGLSGMLSGITGGLIGTDTIANFTERAGSFITGGGFKTEKEKKEADLLSAQQDEAEMNALLASRGIVRTSDGSYTQADNSVHAQILRGMGYESAPAPQGQELAPLNEGFGGSMSSSVSNVTNNNTTNVIPESPRFRINDQATLALASQGL